jgi:hypothetical protein
MRGLVVGLAVAFIALLAACGNEEELVDSSPPAVSATVIPSPSMPADPFVTATGVLSHIAVENENGGFLRVCVADAEVTVEAGRVDQIIRRGTTVTIDSGEVVRETATVPLGPTVPVYRGSDGVLVFGYKSCEEFAQPTATSTP